MASLALMERYESPVERQIREAQERSEFDDLPGAGKPLPNLGGSDDPDWWVRGLIRREGLDMTGALPPGVALRKEAAGFPESLLELGTEESVRAVLEDFNDRARRSRLQLVTGRHPPILAPTVDVDEMVRRWGELRSRAQHPSGHGVRFAEGDGSLSSATGARVRRRWFRRRPTS
jgi:hypothetical protein